VITNNDFNKSNKIRHTALSSCIKLHSTNIVAITKKKQIKRVDFSDKIDIKWNRQVYET